MSQLSLFCDRCARSGPLRIARGMHMTTRSFGMRIIVACGLLLFAAAAAVAALNNNRSSELGFLNLRCSSAAAAIPLMSHRHTAPALPPNFTHTVLPLNSIAAAGVPSAAALWSYDASPHHLAVCDDLESSIRDVDGAPCAAAAAAAAGCRKENQIQ